MNAYEAAGLGSFMHVSWIADWHFESVPHIGPSRIHVSVAVCSI
jgi:hypothetical protein